MRKQGSNQTVYKSFLSPAQDAFTLIELLVVCVLVSIMLVVSVPVFRNTLFSDPLRKAARIIIGTIKEVRLAADGTIAGCNLEINLDEDLIGYSCATLPDNNNDPALEQLSGKTVKLPSGAHFYSVWSGRNQNVTAGTVNLWVNNNGVMDRWIINITDESEEMALIGTVFLSEISIENRAMSIEELNDR